ncbi:Rrf2 family transcriptional regulator [uncultured Tateyamaria sp.]|uniref:RrF2 family transcriptional regulator n=1 Tax=uncultured Tateyamaria sp. TaxID=455651 RepID=UPI00260870AB|nr:Rrf2 family transcriptional regulator [uncultured Tateyamaria sp.]
MRTDSRLSRILHVLMHLGECEDPMTSQVIGQMLGTNPSLVRRTMGGLRDAGILGSTKGHGGGWYLERPLTDISLADVYAALGEPKLFAIGASDDTPTCLLERSANAATRAALDAARERFLDSLTSQSVADLIDQSRDEIAAFQRKASASSD